MTSTEFTHLVINSLQTHGADLSLIQKVIKDMTDALKSYTGGTIP